MNTIRFRHYGDLKSTDKLLRKLLHRDSMTLLRRYGERGVQALREATPKRSGKTADCWGYDIIKNGHNYRLIWTNSNTKEGYAVALLIQYGHGTRGGTFVSGQDYINPALRPVLQELGEALWGEVTIV